MQPTVSGELSMHRFRVEPFPSTVWEHKLEEGLAYSRLTKFTMEEWTGFLFCCLPTGNESNSNRLPRRVTHCSQNDWLEAFSWEEERPGTHGWYAWGWARSWSEVFGLLPIPDDEGRSTKTGSRMVPKNIRWNTKRVPSWVEKAVRKGRCEPWDWQRKHLFQIPRARVCA